MADLNVDSFANAAGTGAPDFPQGVKVAGNALPTSGALSNRNKIINGGMVIAQRTTAALTVNNNGFSFPVDRFSGYSNTAATVFTVQQSAVAPAGFVNSIIATVTTSGTPAANTESKILQYIEGFNVADFGFGTANAISFTLSFWVRSSVPGVYAIGVFNGAGTRVYSTTYTINAADTFEYKTITIPGDTAGTWLTNNGIGIGVNWYLGTGANFEVAAGAWTTKGGAYASADSIYGASNAAAVDWVTNSGATFYLTGVQLEPGDTATPFEQRSVGQELALCQRYYYNQGWAYMGRLNAGSELSGRIFWPQTLRAAPSVSMADIDTDNTGNPTVLRPRVDGVDWYKGRSSNEYVVFRAIADAEL